MKIIEDKIYSEVDGLPLSFIIISPDCDDGCKPVAVLQIAHGMCGCKERFVPFMRFMSSKGVICVANDHRGHGDSVLDGNDRGHMYDGGYKALVKDMRKLTEYVRTSYSGLPFYLIGHSMGSLAAVLYARTYDDIDGLILCSPPSYKKPYVMLEILLRVLTSVGLDRMRLSKFQNLASNLYDRKFAGEGSYAWTCSDPEQRKRFLVDPKSGFSFTANGCMNLFSMLREVFVPRSAGTFKSRVMILHGIDDPCTQEGRSVMSLFRSFYSSVGDIRTIGYYGMRHELLHEIDKERVWNDVLEFVYYTIGPSAG